MDKYVLDAQRAHLVGLLDAIQRCVYSLDASGQKLTWPLSAEFLEKHKKNVEIFESLAAINERFAKLQDTLGAAMRHANLLAGEPSETFLKVLGFYEKAGVLESVASWQLCRTTRSLATHDYETEYAEIADHFNSLQTLISEGAQEVRRPPSSRRSRGFCRSPRVSVGVDKIQGNRHGVESFVPVMARRGVACRDGRRTAGCRRPTRRRAQAFWDLDVPKMYTEHGGAIVGFAHGFYVTSESAECMYKCTDYYAPEYERCIRWNDFDPGINWPIVQGRAPLLSEKDAMGLNLLEADCFP